MPTLLLPLSSFISVIYNLEEEISTLVTNEEIDNGVLGACTRSNSEQNITSDRR